MIQALKVISKSTDSNLRIDSLPDNIHAKPFIKWAGGKRQSLTRFHDLYPTELKEGVIKNFYEPFLGSGAVFFDIMHNYKIRNAYLYDINEDLILTYKIVQKKPIELIEILEQYQTHYLKLTESKRKEYFYEQRKNYNDNRLQINFKRYSDNWIPRAAQFIFLNKTCFNGLYRVNLLGSFNSPKGYYEPPSICDGENLLKVSEVLQIAEIERMDYNKLKIKSTDESFIYFDPPYRPLNKTSSFKTYYQTSFDDEEQKKLADFFKSLSNSYTKLMLSNSDPKNIDPKDDFFEKIYNEYIITRIPSRRMINSNATKRGNISELVITNYLNNKKEKSNNLKLVHI
jgi:DNA adenine methylase